VRGHDLVSDTFLALTAAGLALLCSSLLFSPSRKERRADPGCPNKCVCNIGSVKLRVAGGRKRMGIVVQRRVQ